MRLNAWLLLLEVYFSAAQDHQERHPAWELLEERSVATLVAPRDTLPFSTLLETGDRGNMFQAKLCRPDSDRDFGPSGANPMQGVTRQQSSELQSRILALEMSLTNRNLSCACARPPIPMLRFLYLPNYFDTSIGTWSVQSHFIQPTTVRCVTFSNYHWLACIDPVPVLVAPRCIS